MKFEGTPEEVAALLSRPDFETVRETLGHYQRAAERIRDLLDKRVAEFCDPNDRVRHRTALNLRTDVRAILAAEGL